MTKIANNIIMENKNNKNQNDSEETVNNKEIQLNCFKRKTDFYSSEEKSSDSEDFLIKKN